MLGEFWKFLEELHFSNSDEYSPDGKQEGRGVGKRLERASKSPWRGF